jgi:phosphoribosyl-ATP pyrophosphohydrolase
MSEVSDFMENNKHLFEKAQKMRDSGNSDADLLFHLLHMTREKCIIIDDLRAKLKKNWNK